VSCRHCREDNETVIHLISDCGHLVQHRLNTIGVHQMPEDKPEWDMESMLQFLRKEEIILMEDCRLHTRCELMIAQNVQISDTVANALVLVYFKNNPCYSLHKKNFPLFCPVHLFDSC
jgi:hypothetical protein